MPRHKKRDPNRPKGEKSGRNKAVVSTRGENMIGKVNLTPRQMGQIRLNISEKVVKHIENADKVLDGTVKWSPTQARVFVALLNKVVPDISATFHRHETAETDVNNLTIEELEAIAAGRRAESEAHKIEAEEVQELDKPTRLEQIHLYDNKNKLEPIDVTDTE